VPTGRGRLRKGLRTVQIGSFETVNKVVSLLVVSLVAVGITAASGSAARSHASGVATPKVTIIAVSPTPFYADITGMKVTFTTPVPAPAGQRYFVGWYSEAPRSTWVGCTGYSDVDVPGYRGGTNTRVVTIVRPSRILGDKFCAGPSSVKILLGAASAATGKATGTSAPYLVVGNVSLRVLHAH